jgi:hypothetical protein
LIADGARSPSPFAAFGGFSLSRREREGGAQRRKGEGGCETLTIVNP